MCLYIYIFVMVVCHRDRELSGVSGRPPERCSGVGSNPVGILFIFFEYLLVVMIYIFYIHNNKQHNNINTLQFTFNKQGITF